MYYYLNNFYFFSVIGYFYEFFLHFLFHHRSCANPFVGPWMPIYGFGIVIMILLIRFVFHRFRMPKWAKGICLFLLTIIFLTILEEIGGVLTEMIFHKSFWNYTNFRFHYGKYIALEVSIGWGIASLLFLYFVKPWTDKIMKKIPHFLTILFSIIFLCDFIYSFFI